MALADVFLLRSQYRSFGRVWSVNLHYESQAPIAPETAAQSLIDAWTAALPNDFLFCMAADTTWEGVSVTSIMPANAMPAHHDGISAVGFEGGESVPPNTCAVLSLGSDGPALIRPGRIYLGGVPNGQVTLGRITQAFVNGAYTTLADNLKAQLAATPADFKLVVLKRTVGAPPHVPLAAVEVDTIRVTDILYTQRRRNSKQLGSAA